MRKDAFLISLFLSGCGSEVASQQALKKIFYLMTSMREELFLRFFMGGSLFLLFVMYGDRIFTSAASWFQHRFSLAVLVRLIVLILALVKLIMVISILLLLFSGNIIMGSFILLAYLAFSNCASKYVQAWEEKANDTRKRLLLQKMKSITGAMAVGQLLSWFLRDTVILQLLGTLLK